MKHNRDSLYLLHIRECLDRVAEYTAIGWENFQSSQMTQDAVLRNLQTLGESMQRLSDSLKAANPQVEWRGIAALRNTLVHDYLGIKLGRIWEIITDDLPPFEQQIDAMLQSVFPT